MSIFECKKFEQQTLISAIPHAQEFQEISSVLPQGIGPIGIYHSHPYSSDVFHSHDDDSTLLSLTRQFPNSVSIVTNGKELNCYQMDENDNTRSINLKYKVPEVPRFLLIKVEQEYKVKIHKHHLKSINKNQLLIKIVNKFREFLENLWDDFIFQCRDEKILLNKKVSEFLVNNMAASPIELQIMDDASLKNKINRLVIKPESFDSDKIDHNDYRLFEVNLNANLPIYVPEPDISFSEIKPLIKTELIGNNLLQKLYNAHIDYDTFAIILPKDIFINFFGFFMKIMLHTNNSVQKSALKDKTEKYILKMLSFLDTFIGMDLKQSTKDSIRRLLTHLIKVANDHNLRNIILKNSNNITNALKD